MRELGQDLLEKINGGIWWYPPVVSTDELWTNFEREYLLPVSKSTNQVLVTLSYVVHQKDVTTEHVEEWAELISKIARRWPSREVRVLSTTANSQALRHLDIRPILKDAIRRRGCDVTAQPVVARKVNQLHPGRSEGLETRVVSYNNVQVGDWLVKSG
jgi:hypothetical protein